MNPKLILVLVVVSSGALAGCSTAGRTDSKVSTNATISPKAEAVLRQLAAYYRGLKSFEGTNTITDEMPSPHGTHRLTVQKRFAFVRPNKFFLVPEGTNDSQLYCDGTRLWEFKPYYHKSYTMTPAPARFQDAITNWAGGELVRLIVNRNQYQYLMSGFGRGITGLRYDGKEVVAGVACHHLLFEEAGSRTAQLWVAGEKSPWLVKYVFRYPDPSGASGVCVHTETISEWKANGRIPPDRFRFVPPAGAIKHAPEADQVELSYDSSTGENKVRFYSKTDPKTDSQEMQAVAIQAILERYPRLASNDLFFTGVKRFKPADGKETLTVGYELPKTAEIRVVNGSVQTKMQTLAVTLSPRGQVKSVSKGVSVSFH